MFLDNLCKRNPAFVEAAIRLHQAGKIPANAYVIDADAVQANATAFAAAAAAHNMAVYAMTKQAGRNSGFCRALRRGGIERAVAVDMACALACHQAGLGIGHLGHLVQIPRAEAATAARLAPDHWTVFSADKAQEAAAAARVLNRQQALLARIHADGDVFYRGHEGGFAAKDVLSAAAALNGNDGAYFAGITSFPALLYDHDKRTVAPTPNLRTLSATADALARGGYGGIAVNAPGTTSSVTLKTLADAGATQCEPGHGLLGSTPLHAVQELPETPAMLYLSEVSHRAGGHPYCFGGGMYIDPVFPDYPVRAVVSAEPTVNEKALAEVELPPPAAIDYYGIIRDDDKRIKTGDSVVFGFRAQAFVTRAFVVCLRDVAGGGEVECVENGFGAAQPWQR